jgi:hypothetical protein
MLLQVWRQLIPEIKTELVDSGATTTAMNKDH